MTKCVRINQEECLGCEACVEICPSIFAFDHDGGKAYVQENTDGMADCVDEAIASCPAGCIHQDE